MNQPDRSAEIADFISTLPAAEQLFVKTYRLFESGEKSKIPEADQARASELILRGAIYTTLGPDSGTLLKIK